MRKERLLGSEGQEDMWNGAESNSAWGERLSGKGAKFRGAGEMGANGQGPLIYHYTGSPWLSFLV